MRRAICAAIILVATADLSLPSQCQICQVSDPGAEPLRWTAVPPFTREAREITFQTRADGTSVPLETDELSAQDSQRRTLSTSTSAESGFGKYTVVDPVPGTRTVWDTGNKQVSVLKSPMPIPGRKS